MFYFALVLTVVCTQTEPCDQGDSRELAHWQQALLSDFPDGKSALGQVCFTTSQAVQNPKAQARFILGVKTIVNFMYDLCKVVFDELIDETNGSPDFVMGYWGRAMCNFQGVWNAENPVDSALYLARGCTLPA